eukprot:752101-Prorocentrum_lima.AAC.1
MLQFMRRVQEDAAEHGQAVRWRLFEGIGPAKPGFKELAGVRGTQRQPGHKERGNVACFPPVLRA